MKQSDIREIRIDYFNGESLVFGSFEIEKIKKMGEAVQWLERARQVYEQLTPLFKPKDET